MSTVPDTLKLTVVSPDRALVDAEADEVDIPGLDGYMGVLPNHAPLFSELSIGRLSYTRHGKTESIALAGGFVEILNNHVRVLATIAEAAADIDVARARAALERAEGRLSGLDSGTDQERARAAQRRAAARLDVAGPRE